MARRPEDDNSCPGLVRERGNVRQPQEATRGYFGKEAIIEYAPMSGLKNWVGPVLGAVAGYYTGGTGTAAVEGLLVGTAAQQATKTPKIPEVPKPTLLPTIDDNAVKEAKRRSLLEQVARRGRASTILTGTTDKLGD